jgi:hypothetical protein
MQCLKERADDDDVDSDSETDENGISLYLFFKLQ